MAYIDIIDIYSDPFYYHREDGRCALIDGKVFDT